MKKYFDSVEKGIGESEKKIEEIKRYAENCKKENPNISKKDYVSKVNADINEKHLIPLYYSAFDNKLDSFIERLEVWKYIDIFGISAEPESDEQ